MSEQQRRIDRILSSDYLADLDARGGDELRAMRVESAELETEYSYIRRLAQARIEILQAELARRRDGRPLSDLVEALPRILADERPRSAPVRTRIPALLAPRKLDGYSRGLERLVEDDTLAKLPTLDTDEVHESIAQLEALEREVSEVRRRLHGILDRLAEALGARGAVS